MIDEQLSQQDRPGNVADMLRRICGATVTALSASGVGVSVLTGDGDWGFAIASDPASQVLEELQFTLGGEGRRSVFAFPLLVGNTKVGVLDVFRERPGAMSDEDLALGASLTHPA
ncbi:GAF domain-containing protein [Asanoa ferruginea]|uniref:GAF domain-containing protein n=1 Tax=Asanoa ferruginea TaxID=53367 RepID=UPI0011C103C2|nr:GAF domain-containing protein [Asanoa ferruginea]